MAAIETADLTEHVLDVCKEFAAREAGDRVQKIYDHIKPALESPIEEAFGAAMVGSFYDYAGPHLKTHFCGGYAQLDEPVMASDVVIKPQCYVHGYRVDMAFQIMLGDAVRVIAVECDGHEYHERTKEQARRDRQRDRRLTSQGVTVIRFTGSEIWHDPIVCVAHVNNEIYRLVEEGLG